MAERAEMERPYVDDLGYGDLESEQEACSTRWVHVPARETLRLEILSERPVKYWAHWVMTRMLACPGEIRCAHCARHMGGQFRYAYSVLDVDTRAQAFFEVGPATARTIRDATIEFGGLRGLIFAFRHLDRRRNGQIIGECLGRNRAAAELPAAGDPREQLERQMAAEAGKMMPAPMPESWPVTSSTAEASPYEAPKRNGAEAEERGTVIA
jgi:hypothetical protein